MSEVPPCRICGKRQWVAAWHEDKPETAVCIECCPKAEHADGETGHVWAHDPPERDWSCIHCGQMRRNTDDWPEHDD